MALGDGQAATVGEAVESPHPEVVNEAPVAGQAATDNPRQATAPANGQAIAAALHKRLEFWKDKLANATEESMVEAAADSIERIKREAAAAGVNLDKPAPARVVNQPTRKAASKTKQPRSVVEKEALGSITAAKLSEQAAKAPAGEAKAKKPPKPKVMKLCLDGCGAMVAGQFQMGHDAKLKSLLLKVERGEVPMEQVPDIVAGIVKFKKGPVEELKDAKGVTTGKVQTYILLAAPVKFHGRPEVQITQREPA